MPSSRWNLEDNVIGWWIKLPEHVSMKTDGYLCISKKPYSELKHQLQSWARSHLSELMNSRLNDIQFIPVIAGIRRDVMAWRATYRPNEHIGTSHTRKECHPPLAFPGMHSDAFRKRQSERMKKNNPMDTLALRRKASHSRAQYGDLIRRSTGEILYENVRVNDIQHVIGIEKRRLMRWKNNKKSDFFFVKT